MLRILINPAHGGNDLGHRSFQAYSLICEKRLCTSFIPKTAGKSKGGWRSGIFNTGQGRSDVNSEPSAMTDQMDVFISNHLNMGRKRGIEIYYSVHSDGKLANRLKKRV